MYICVESTQVCSVCFPLSYSTTLQIFSRKGSVQVVSDKEDERFQASICLRLPIAKVHFGHSNFKLENVKKELFFLDLNIYAHFAICISPNLLKIHSLGTGAEDPDSNKKTLCLLAAPASAL